MDGSKSAVKMDDSYAKNSTMQQSATGRMLEKKALADRVTRYITENAEEFKNSPCFRIAEYGCADGSNSLAIHKQLIEAVRAQDASKPVEILCNDLPSANFTKLFENLNPLKEEFDNIFISSTGQTFYNQLFPSGSIDVAFSFTSVHWLSDTPCFLGSTVYTAFGLDELDEESKNQWEERGRKDWRCFMEHRAKELKPNGFFYQTTIGYHSPASDKNKEQIWGNVHTMKAIVNVLEKQDLVKYKHEFNLPIFFRQKEHYVEPFEGENSLPFTIDHYEDYDIEIQVLVQIIENWDLEKLLMMVKAGGKAITGPYYTAKIAKIGEIEGFSKEKQGEILESLYEGMHEGLDKLITKENAHRGMTYSELFVTKN